MIPEETGYPLVLKGELTEPLSRWLWLVKWFLLIPHIYCPGLFMGGCFCDVDCSPICYPVHR